MISILPHLIRPYYLWGLLFVALLGLSLMRRNAFHNPWASVCDPHLLRVLLRHQPHATKRSLSTWCLIGCLSFLCMAAAGPAWQQRPLPLYTQNSPKIILLSLSQSMLTPDLKPTRLARALFILHDILRAPNSAPIGLIAYTGEPFIVSPITDDAHTIVTLLPELTPDIMPVEGQNLTAALVSAQQLLQQAHLAQGSLLILTDTAPDQEAIAQARTLAKGAITLSLLPLLPPPFITPAFQAFATAGKGQVLSTEQYLSWLSQRASLTHTSSLHIEQWKDQGRWFILPALACCLPLFQRRRTVP